jgi:hypothetical protein
MTKTKKPTPVEGMVTVGIDEIIPYWRNPRNATDADIAKVMMSITEYGYQAPIIVDADNVIIVGHTRYLALRRLGWTEVPVMVSDLEPHSAKEYRIIDNRAGEFTAWDRDLLLTELRGFTSEEMLNAFFPDMDLTAELTDEALLPPIERPGRNLHDDPVFGDTCICPHCFHQFSLASLETASPS